MMHRHLPLQLITLTLVALGTCSAARAHYLWVDVTTGSDGAQEALVIFEEQPRFGDGGYLDPFVKGCRTWVRTLQSEEAKSLSVSEVKQDGKRWLAGELPVKAPWSVEAYGKFGVYRYGKIDALLHYYAKHLEVDDHDALHDLARARKLDLDIVPHPVDGQLELRVRWRNEPAKDLRIYVRGPKGFRTTVTTDDQGLARCETEEAGKYTFRATLIEPNKPGMDDGKPYEQVRHSSTLVMRLPVD